MEFISLKEKTSYMIATGVGLILLGVSLLIFLATLVERNLIFKFLPQNAREALPVIVLFLFIIPAVILFMYTENKLQKFKFIEEGNLKSHRV